MASLVCYEPALAPRTRQPSQIGYNPALAPRAVPTPKEFHEVWEDNLREEFGALCDAVTKAGGSEATIAMDMEFPGFPCNDPRFSSPAAHYQALRSNVDQLWPIQLGLAVVGADGIHRGIWTFNIHFDADVDNHTEESLAFLRAAGIDFPRHRTKGITALDLGRHLANSDLLGPHGHAPCWLTFSGSYDWGYLLKLVTSGRALPGLASTFDKVLSVYIPKRWELRDLLPNGSLEVLGHKYGVRRWGTAHTAGSDALLTLELFMLLGGRDLDSDATSIGEMHEEEEWAEMNWQNGDDWYAGSTDPWYPGCENATQMALAPWGNSTWAHHSQANNEWFFPRSTTPLSSKSPVWFPLVYNTIVI